MRIVTACIALLAPFVGNAAAARTPEIVLTELDSARWRLEYRLDKPARALHFSRALPELRSRRWRPAEKGFEIRRRDGAEILTRADGAPFRQIAFEVAAREFGLEGNYEPFLRYSDGAVLAYTGYYFACADAPCTASATWRVTAEPARRRKATRGAGPVAGPLAFVDAGDGSYVYVGSAKVVHARAFTAIPDPALPPDVARALSDTLPKILRHYEDRLGALPRKPAFFVTMGAGKRASGYESRGSALPDQVSIHLSGPGWRDPRGVEPGFLPWYFAHEAAHLQQRIEDRPNADDFMAEGWIHEGGAEAMAALAVAAVHPALAPYVERRIAAAAEECEDGLHSLGAPLNASIDRGAADNYYVCGLAMQIAIDRDVRDASDGARDLFDVWRAFLDATGRGAKWNEATFLKAARGAGAREETLQLVSALARKRAAWAQDALKERLLAAPKSELR